MEFKPYCPQCASVRPDDLQAVYSCRPCAKQGHAYRLVADEADRQARIARWAAYYDRNEFTQAERAAIPHYQNLLHIPAAAVIESREGQHNDTRQSATSADQDA